MRKIDKGCEVLITLLLSPQRVSGWLCSWTSGDSFFPTKHLVPHSCVSCGPGNISPSLLWQWSSTAGPAGWFCGHPPCSHSIRIRSFASKPHVCELSPCGRARFFVTPWTVAHQAPLSMGDSRQEYWSGLPLPPLGHLPNPGIKPESLCFRIPARTLG